MPWARWRTCASRSSRWRWTAPSWPTRCPPTPRPSRPHRARRAAAEPDRAGGGAPGGVVLLSGPRRSASSRTARPAQGRGRRHRRAAAAAGAKRFVAHADWAALQHLPRYLKAVVLRLDKLRADPARDARAWPSCARWSSAGCAAGRAARAQHAGWTSTAGCWKSCASACSRRNCARRSRSASSGWTRPGSRWPQADPRAGHGVEGLPKARRSKNWRVDCGVAQTLAPGWRQ
jgi:hypothetical protein